MKKRIMSVLLVAAMSIALAACGGNETNNGANSGTSTPTNTPTSTPTSTPTATATAKPDKDETKATTTTEISDALLAKFEQPALMPVEGDMLKDLYNLDAALLEEYTIKMPMMNVKTNELAVIKVKDAKSIPTVEKALKQRAANVQKQFETYLQDQYEIAKDYKLVTKGNYVLFVIAEDADKIVAEFETLVK